jgi:hypothetical protein
VAIGGSLRKTNYFHNPCPLFHLWFGVIRQVSTTLSAYTCLFTVWQACSDQEFRVNYYLFDVKEQSIKHIIKWPFRRLVCLEADVTQAFRRRKKKPRETKMPEKLYSNVVYNELFKNVGLRLIWRYNTSDTRNWNGQYFIDFEVINLSLTARWFF